MANAIWPLWISSPDLVGKLTIKISGGLSEMILLAYYLVSDFVAIMLYTLVICNIHDFQSFNCILTQQ